MLSIPMIVLLVASFVGPVVGNSGVDVVAILQSSPRRRRKSTKTAPTPAPTWMTQWPTPAPTWKIRRPTPAPTGMTRRPTPFPTPTACLGLVGLEVPTVRICNESAPTSLSQWRVVVNNGVTVPGDTRTFNSYNQPSLNVDRLVVFRGRSKGGMGGGSGEPAHGVYRRDMACNAPITVVLDRRSRVPEPNNLGATFIEPPSFPRIDMWSQTVVSRGVHPPAWRYIIDDDSETRAGTTGIYADPFGPLITAQSNLGDVPTFTFFQAPGDEVRFDVFPGAPSVTDGATIVFKGNYNEKTGVFYRDVGSTPIDLPNGSSLKPAGGMSTSVLLASTDTLIPGTLTPFGSTAPPSAAGRFAVFAGFDNESAPTLGGIYMVPLDGPDAPLTALVEIGSPVPNEAADAVFNELAEAVSFDGRFVGFWGAWGNELKDLTLLCPQHGNQNRTAYCNEMFPYGFNTTVPVHQGIFVLDTLTSTMTAAAKSGDDFDDFIFWGFSGRVPGLGDDTGELARWRSSPFVAVSGLVNGTWSDDTAHIAFKARIGEVVNATYANDSVDGIYLRRTEGERSFPVVTVVATGMSGTLFDLDAVDPETDAALPVAEMGIERDGFRGNSLAITLGMGTEDAGWAGVYLTDVLDCAR